MMDCRSLIPVVQRKCFVLWPKEQTTYYGHLMGKLQVWGSRGAPIAELVLLTPSQRCQRQ